MQQMESIKNSFKHDYNLAVDYFNKKDYTSFLETFVQPLNCCVNLLSMI